MKNTFVRTIEEHVELHFDERTGLAWVEDGRTGTGHSAHPNIDASGSVRGMKKLGHWGKDDVCVRSHGFVHNTSRLVVTSEFDEIARQHCRCGGKH